MDKSGRCRRKVGIFHRRLSEDADRILPGRHFESEIYNDATIRPWAELTSAAPPLTYAATAANQSIYVVLVGPDVQPAGSIQYGSQANFDKISLTDAPPAVPEAASSISLGLMLTLGGLIVAVRRKSIRS